MKIVIVTCDICNKPFNKGNIIDDKLYLKDIWKGLEGHLNGQFLEINYFLHDTLENIDLCPYCYMKLIKYINFLENL